MRILIATDNYYPHVSGTPVFTWRLAYNLEKRGHSVLVIAPSKTIRYEFYEHKGIGVYGIPSIPSLVYDGFRISIPFFIKKAIKEKVKEFKPDIVHIQDHFTIGSTALEVANDLAIPSVGTNSFMPENLLHHIHTPKFMEAFMYRLIVRHFCNVYNKLVAVETPTKSAAELLRRVNLSKPTYIISHGVDLKRFNPKNNSGIVKKRYRIPNKPIMLYVGRIDKEKRIDSIVKSMPLILKEIDVHLVIAGCGAETQNLRNLVKNLGINKNITFTGFVPDNYLPNLYCIADCFVIASIAELQSFVTMEAMASGLPVIAAKAMALPELVQHGKNGYLFKPNDIKSITKYSVEILSNKNLRIKMSKKSLEIIQKHKVEKTIDQFELLYKSLKK